MFPQTLRGVMPEHKVNSNPIALPRVAFKQINRAQSDSTAVKLFALYTVELSLIPSIPEDPVSIARSNS